ncbi:MAG: aldo/keto reductase [Ardenticatenaceae bacterium]|nr:aldo/keto reductase [Anaerolineales bacterium]MCB8923633.1 aldo/keto reductase [Ardenticatenaceae bacterium]MCB8991852.1 aldo/keto reductase [Ardenticatenaceae bacterium]MCB9005139.1 aldo/keto reductase [Ardenticatenaceae bacterium]
MTIPGKATPTSTQTYAAKFSQLHYRPLNNWAVSEAGFGSYRIDPDVEPHRAALTHALRSGVNLIDTSSNYADGGSETIIGQVLGGLLADGTLAREQLVVVSKVGYLQGQALELSQQRKADGDPFPDLVEYADHLEHCIHPDFIADQLTRSLERLNLKTLDVYLLHNPEYYLGWAHQAGIPADEAESEYYRRLALALRHLEAEVDAGRIQCYGVSSNTFPVPVSDPQFTSLTKLLAIADDIERENGRPHHFRVVQFPMNLFESEAITQPNQPGEKAVLETAHEAGLGVLINRPLNAIQDNAVTRLADVPAPAYPASKFEVSTTVDMSVRVERILQDEILPALPLDDETRQQVLEYMAVGIMLQGQWRAFGTYHNWRDVRSRFILPRARSGTQFLANIENPPVNVDSWLEGYVNSLNTMLAAVTSYYQGDGHKLAQAIREKAVAADADWAAGTLSQTAVRALRSTLGVTAVLIGMRQQAYVDDVLHDLRNPVTQQDRRAAWQEMAQKE